MKSWYWTSTTFEGNYPNNLDEVIDWANAEINKQFKNNLSNQELDVFSDQLWEQYCRDVGRPVTHRKRSVRIKYNRQMTAEEIMGVPFRYLLSRIGMTAPELAERHSIPLRTVQRWAAGDNQCLPYVKLMLAELHGLRLWEEPRRRRRNKDEEEFSPPDFL